MALSFNNLGPKKKQEILKKFEIITKLNPDLRNSSKPKILSALNSKKKVISDINIKDKLNTVK